MKKMTRLFCLLLALAYLLSACGADTPVATTSTTKPTAKPVIPPVNKPVEPDPYRALPVLEASFVTDEAADGDLILAQKGKAKATIVYAAGIKKAETAANDLANYLNKITGATFKVVSEDTKPLPSGNLILVGNTQKAAAMGVGPYTGYPDAEKFTVKRDGNCLILCGNDDASYYGTADAVTYFLEKAGCGWFGTDELWQIVPEMATMAVTNVDYTVTPQFSARISSYIDTGLRDRWYEGGDHTLFGQRIWIYIPLSTYETHPEWFALVNGERKKGKGISEWQYCYSNEELAAAYAQKMIEEKDKKPTLTTLPVAVNDGWTDGWCECEECAALGNKADQALVFANRVAEIVTEKYPDVLFTTLAYHDTFLPPTKVKAHENVEVMFCVETSPFDDLMAEVQIHSGFNYINKITYTQSWLGNVKQWIEAADVKHSAIWGWLGIDERQYGWDYVPWVQGIVASRNMELFKQLGIETVFYDGFYPETNVLLRWPLYYTLEKCMYFGDVTGEEVLYDACQKLYGAAADEMFLYYRHLADATQANVDSAGINWVPPKPGSVYWYNFEHTQAAYEAAKAKLDQLTPEQKTRVEEQLKFWDYTVYQIS